MTTQSHHSTRALTEAAMMVALAQALSYVKLAQAPNGGAVTAAMLPILIYAVRWGLRPGLAAGFLFGLLQLIFDGAYAWGWQSMLLDYLAAFAPLGLAGLFHGKKWGIFAGTLLGCAARFAVHFLSGITVYRIVAPVEFWNRSYSDPALYSLVYNGSYMLPNTLIALLLAAVLYRPMRRYLTAGDVS